ncbi:MAG: phasin family protein [Candidatus Thiosymbion ectosymbiont of Robbea hypermnestra]|nr:phasin family protein [Candidatus Thiosymbion ectosymbiont of Robbea hypermnestra]
MTADTTDTKLEAVKEVANKAMENLTKLADLNLETFDKVTSNQKAAMDLFMERSKRQVELAKKAKGFDEFVKGQAELAKETSELMLEESQKSVQFLNEMRDAYATLFKDEISKFTNKFNT